MIVDTLGLLLAVVVHPANENDGQAAPSVLKRLLGKVPRLKVIFADSMQGVFRAGSFGGASTGFLLPLASVDRGAEGGELRLRSTSEAVGNRTNIWLVWRVSTPDSGL